MRSLAALPAALFLLSASPAHATDWRWPWEPPKPAPERRDDRDRGREYDHRDRGYPQPAPEYRGNSYDTEFVTRMLANTREQLSLAESARHSRDRDVRNMAERTLSEAGAFEQTLLARADEMGLRVPREGARVSARDDLSYLARTLDVIAAERPYFASYKSSVGGSFHDALQRHWDDMVYRRDDVKRLHDRVRNETRRGRYS